MELFTSPLYNRKKKTLIDGVKSTITNINAWLPQDFRLGSLLFIIYINDITNIGFESEILTFAVDCTILISDEHPKKTVTILNSYLNNLSTWATKWKI